MEKDNLFLKIQTKTGHFSKNYESSNFLLFCFYKSHSNEMQNKIAIILRITVSGSHFK